MAETIPKEDEEIPNPNPITTEYAVADEKLVVTETPQNPITKTTNYPIEVMENEMQTIDGSIALWQAKKDDLQTKIDKYNELA